LTAIPTGTSVISHNQTFLDSEESLNTPKRTQHAGKLYTGRLD
jgi:hypothetical protein